MKLKKLCVINLILHRKKITDKNGKQRTVWVRPGENPVADKGKKAEDTTEKQSTKPKHSVGDIVTLDGAKGDFKVSSIDKDGTYHVVSADGKTGYKVSENHINGAEKVSVGNREMTADNKKISDKLDEITNKLDKEKDPVKRKELLNQMKDIQANGSKSKYFEQKQETKESEKKDYSAMSKDELLSAYNSTKDMDERDKIMAAFDKADKKESKTDLAGAEDKKMYDAYQQMADDEDKAFYESEKKEQKNSSNEKSTKKGYRKGDHVYDRYGERYTITGVDGDHVTAKKDGRSEEKSYSENSFEGIVAGSKNDFDGSNPDTDKALETYRNQINDIKKTNPSAYIEWVGQANKDYKKYKEFKEKADTVARAPMFATFPEYATAKHEAEKLEKKYPDFKENADKNMAYYKFV